MNKFRIVFDAVKLGAIGVESKHYVDVIASNEESARLALYRDYEHIRVRDLRIDPDWNVYQSVYAIGIYICVAFNGCHLQKDLRVESPLELIDDPEIRKLVILEMQGRFRGFDIEFKRGDTVTFRASKFISNRYLVLIS